MTFVFCIHVCFISVLMILKRIYDVSEQLSEEHRNKSSRFTALLNHTIVNENVVRL